MSKFPFSLILVVSVLSATSTHAEGEKRKLLAEKYTFGELPFENGKFKNDVAGSYNVGSNEASTTKAFEAATGVSHRIKWGNETIENEQVLAITETKISDVKDSKGNFIKKDLWARTTTISGDDLRSVTTCYGQPGKKMGLTNNKMKCVTATRRACDRLLSVYNSADGRNGQDLNATAKEANYCAGILTAYQNMAKAMAQESTQLAGRREDVMDGDMDRVKSLMKEATGGNTLELVSLKAKSSGEALDKMAKDYAASMDGMRALNTVLAYCIDGKDFFSKTSGSAGPSSASQGNKTAQ